MSSPGLAGNAAAVGWGSTECFCLLCSLSTQSLFAAVHPLLPPFPSFMASGASHPACSYFWMLLLSPQWKLKHTSPNAARAAVHPWAQHSCSVPLSRTEGGEDPAPPSPVNDFRLLSWTESHSAIREGSLRGVSERIPIHLHLVPS